MANNVQRQIGHEVSETKEEYVFGILKPNNFQTVLSTVLLYVCRSKCDFTQCK